ncbi:hypothetical protein MRX96_012097 [Rhipicephalus microplus]
MVVDNALARSDMFKPNAPAYEAKTNSSGETSKLGKNASRLPKLAAGSRQREFPHNERNLSSRQLKQRALSHKPLRRNLVTLVPAINPRNALDPLWTQKHPPAKKADAKKKVEDNDDSKPVDVSRLDLRVGRIMSAVKHPDADSLYVEQVDVGEEKPRTVVSGLVKFVPLDKMQNRMAVLLCNLKPAKMRGVTSEAMVMCASTPEKVEILAPPPGAQPGDRVVCDGYPGQPDAQLNPKKKIFEQVAPDLKTDSEKRATYRDQPWIVTGHQGHVTAETLCNVQIK